MLAFTVFLLRKSLLEHFDEYLAKANAILTGYPPHKWDGNDKTHCRSALANGFVYRLIQALA